MRAGEKFKRWTVFYNKNGHLSLTYSHSKGDKIQVFNYNGSNYKIKNFFKPNYSFVGRDEEHVLRFFKLFPSFKFEDEVVNRFLEIKDRYLTETMTKGESSNLLLLC